MKEIVLVRADRGQPLRRALIGMEGALTYVCREDAVAAVDSGDKNAVGFKKIDVFQYDVDIYSKLLLLWPDSPTTQDELWNQCTPFTTK